MEPYVDFVIEFCFVCIRSIASGMVNGYSAWGDLYIYCICIRSDCLLRTEIGMVNLPLNQLWLHNLKTPQMSSSPTADKLNESHFLYD